MRSSWNRLTDQHDSVYNLWGCFSQELEIADNGDGLVDDADLDG